LIRVNPSFCISLSKIKERGEKPQRSLNSIISNG